MKSQDQTQKARETIHNPIGVPAIKQFLDLISHSCNFKNQARYICINKKCIIKNPLICVKQNCQCILDHQECAQSTYKAFLKKLQNSGLQLIQLQKRINQICDNLIDKISDQRDKFLLRARQSVSNPLFRQNLINEKVNLSSLKQTGFTGQNTSLTSELLSNDFVNSNFNKALKFLTQQNISLNKKTDRFFQDLYDEFLVEKRYVYWSQQLSSKNNQINGRSVKCISDAQTNVTLLQPSLNQIKGNIIKWRIYITNIVNWVGVGLGLRQFLKKTDFKVSDGWRDQNHHGHYVLGHNRTVWAHKSIAQNDKFAKFGFSVGDTLSLQFNKTNKQLMIKNQKTNFSCVIKVVYEPTKQQDEYHICVSLYKKGDQARLISPVQADGLFYELRVSQSQFQSGDQVQIQKVKKGEISQKGSQVSEQQNQNDINSQSSSSNPSDYNYRHQSQFR